MELVDSVDELRSSLSFRGISMPNFLMRGLFGTGKRRISLEEGPERGIVSFDRLT